MTPVAKWMVVEAASPFGESILTEEYRAIIILHPIHYNGTGDPVDHIQQYHIWMNIRRYSPAMMCQAFSLILTGAGYE